MTYITLFAQDLGPLRQALHLRGVPIGTTAHNPRTGETAIVIELADEKEADDFKRYIRDIGLMGRDLDQEELDA